MSSPVETMKQLLEGLYEEVEEKKSEVRKEGRVSSDFCDLCYSKRWDIVPLASHQQKTMEKLIGWANKYEIISIKKAEAYLSHFEIKSNKQITKGSRARALEDQSVRYVLDADELSRRIESESKVKPWIGDIVESYCAEYGLSLHSILDLVLD